MPDPFQAVLKQVPLWSSTEHCSETPERHFRPFSDCRLDFTLFFEQYFLSTLPCLVFLLLCPFFFQASLKEKKKLVKHCIRVPNLVSACNY
jgi:hypothetical protein